jgi:ferredoxin
MNDLIYYYTGSGNSLWAARYIASCIEGCRIVHMKSAPSHPGDDVKAIGIVFPVHMWGLPHGVVEFLKRLDVGSGRYVFACAVNAGEVAESLVQLSRILSKKGAKLSLGVSLVMPSNYIPWGGPGPEATLSALFVQAKEKLVRFSGQINKRETNPPEKGTFKQKLLYSGIIYKLAYPHVTGMDKNFTVDNSCSSCGICERICPASNITLEDGKPGWHSHCEQCMACIQWCPEQSIQYGEKTRQYERYHHPEITAGDMYLR